MPKLNIIILAAGKGTRMKSKKLKVLQPFSGTTIIEHVLHTSYQLNPDKIIMVYGHQGEQLKKHLTDKNILWVEQVNPNGTGHAVQCALPLLDDKAKCLILVGDAPLIAAKDLKKLLVHTSAVLTAKVNNPFNYGRIIRNVDGSIQAIVEEKDANAAQKQINEINSGIIMTSTENLKQWLSQINTDNAQAELYLTDIIALAQGQGKSFQATQAEDERSINGINDRVQLAHNEAIKQDMLRENLMLQGVTMLDPKGVQIRGFVDCGQDITIDAGVILEGNNKIADDVTIGAYCIIKNCTLGKGTRIAPHSMLEEVITQGDCDIGPYARLRPGTVIGTKAKIGNFVETKKTTIGHNSKASHLTYLGDCEIGDNVNIGAGTITCNYDGVNKFKTIIEDDVFIGSDTQLIAPVTIGKGATIGAGSTITKDAQAEKLTLSRAQQKTLEGWKKPTKSN
ncbi:MAG: bifunctional UDP-N-acetylglucosamine diphosphorylase/glucosamine-1-phosphate N-acetyltransferase GlmU [Proteobacteria bacterium]|nr:bifunctional UDP-N-acetylglucosamine diphosphorylase/glucosamine-1-phosphate N-acetyltransferase GlmU [Pseudomonadota bacterium]